MKKTIILIAMVLVAAIAITAIIVVANSAPQEDIAPAIVGDVTTKTSWPDTADEAVELTPETRVLLVDASGSMDGIVHANSGYDQVVVFSDYLGQSGGKSRIAKNLILTLDMGVKEIGLVSDLESWPKDDLDAFDGKYYNGRELYVFIPEKVDKEDLETYRILLSDAFDSESCTLVFVFQDGKKDVIFDNYSPLSELKPKKVIPDIKVEDNRRLKSGNYIAQSHVRKLWIAFIAITAFLVEVILALLLWYNGNGEPDWVKKALKTGNIALDGSGSVSYVYDDMLQYLKRHKRKIKSIWRFASDVRKVSLSEAKDAQPGGQTHGWEALSQMQADGIEELTILSDMQFNDNPISGLHFKKIIFLVPNGCQDSVEEFKSLCDTYEVITL